MSDRPDTSQQALRPLPKPGQQLGRFAILRKLSQGDTGVVYLAEDVSLGGEVALKILSPSLSESEAFQVLSREVLLTRRLSHPGICRVYDLHEDGPFRFLTMEAIRGPTLDEVLAREGTQGLPPPRAVAIVLGAGEAVAAAHAAGVVHRALRPSVIALREGGEPVVLDFGHARAPGVAGHTVVQRAAAEPGYLAPEVLEGQPADEQSDLYSLGALLYRALTGRTPRETGGAGAAPELPSRLNNLVTRELDAAVMAAISPAPQLRPRGVPSFLDMLRAALPDQQVRARRPRRETSEPILPTARVRRVSLLFSDMVAVTAFFEKHGDLAGRRRIELHNSLLLPVIRRGHGQVLKTIGDSIMALFEDEDEAVESACRMQEALVAQPASAEPIRVRIGVHTGEAIVEIGDAFGDAVNVAARVCARAAGDQILISEDTLRALTRNKGRTRFHERAALKGKSDAIQLFTVEWSGQPRPAPARAQPPGRDTDRDALPLPPGAGVEDEAEGMRPASGPTVVDGRPLAVPAPGAGTDRAAPPIEDDAATQEMAAVSSAAEAPPVPEARPPSREAATVRRGVALDAQPTDPHGAPLPARTGRRSSLGSTLLLLGLLAVLLGVALFLRFCAPVTPS